MTRRRQILASLLVIIIALAGVVNRVDLSFKVLARELNKRYVTWQARGIEAARGEHFIVFGPDEARDRASLVLSTAEKYYPEIKRDFAVDQDLVPAPIIIYSDMEDLNHHFGWYGDFSTMGVYWAGTIHVLDPGVWASGPDIGEQFEASGPMAHEMTHLAVDIRTRGNCPRWLNEGIAQYEEYRLTGFSFGDPRTVNPTIAYSLSELQEFDYLSDQDLAYREVFSIVYFMVERYGWSSIQGVISDLGEGVTVDKAIKDNTGAELPEVLGLWSDWLETGQESFADISNKELLQEQRLYLETRGTNGLDGTLYY